MKAIHVIGGGLAGCEAAWQIARAGAPAVVHEMRPARGTEAHRTDRLAELVCSNSFRSDDSLNNAVGVIVRQGLKENPFDETVDGGVGSDAEGQCKEGNNSKPWRA